MRVKALDIPDVKLITPDRFHDHRGFFSETYNRERYAALGIEVRFVQDNHSYSAARGVVRGLHFQIDPHTQGKLVRVVSGAIFDVALDIRVGSPTFGRHVSAILSGENWAQIWIPEGFAHGFCTLESQTAVLYKTTGYYSPECSRGVRWDDNSLGIPWPVNSADVILSDADRNFPNLADLSELAT